MILALLLRRYQTLETITVGKNDAKPYMRTKRRGGKLKVTISMDESEH